MSSTWWSIPQAIIWIVTRSESQLLRADGVRTMAGVRRMKGIRAASSLDEPPVSLAAAPNEMLHAWRAQRVALFGCKWGKERPRSIARRSDLHLRDYRGEVCLGARTLHFDTHPVWSHLSVRADDCKRCWRAPSRREGARLSSSCRRASLFGQRSARFHGGEAAGAPDGTEESRPRRAAGSGHEPLRPISKDSSRRLEQCGSRPQRWPTEERKTCGGRINRKKRQVEQASKRGGPKRGNSMFGLQVFDREILR